jgi:hypothetical protein
MKILSTCLMTVLVCSCKQYSPMSRSSENAMKRQEEVRVIVSSHLNKGIGIIRGPLTVEEVEKELIVECVEGVVREMYGGLAWYKLKAELRHGDELYFYSSDRESWAQLRGSEGYVAIRGNKVLGSFFTALN